MDSHIPIHDAIHNEPQLRQQDATFNTGLIFFLKN